MRNFNNTKNKVSCKVKAVDLLSRCDQSKNKLMQKLRRYQYDEEEIEATIKWLEEKRYINEESCCQRRFNNMYELESYSVKQICVKLLQQGFQRDIIDECIPENTDEHEYNAAQKIVSRKFKADADRRKIVQYLYGKGFYYEIAQRVAEEFLSENKDEYHS